MSAFISGGVGQLVADAMTVSTWWWVPEKSKLALSPNETKCYAGWSPGMVFRVTVGILGTNCWWISSLNFGK